MNYPESWGLRVWKERTLMPERYVLFSKEGTTKTYETIGQDSNGVDKLKKKNAE